MIISFGKNNVETNYMDVIKQMALMKILYTFLKRGKTIKDMIKEDRFHYQ